MNCVLLIDDLIFETRIRGAADAAGVVAHSVGSVESLRAALDEHTPALVIIDLDSGGCSPIEAVGVAKPHRAKPTVLAYGSHVRADLLSAAADAGADIVWPRSRVHSELALVFERLKIDGETS